MSDLARKFQSILNNINSGLLEMHQAIYLAMLAILTGEHVLFIGPPGGAKTKLCQMFTSCISSSKLFTYLLTKFTEPNEIFGPVDMVAYADQGKYTRISHGSLTEAHLGVLDEVFKANSAILNSLLTLSNERLVYEPGQAPKKAPLISLFGASNELPKPEDGLDALYDRFLIKCHVSNSVAEEQSFELLVSEFSVNGGPEWKPNTTATLKELKKAQAEVGSLPISGAAMDAIKKLRAKFMEQGIELSNRKWVKIGKLIRAAAWLNGHEEVEVEDLEVITCAAWYDLKQVRAVEHIVFEVANPLNLRAVEMEDKARDIYEKIPNEGEAQFTDRIENVLQQLVDIYHSLGEEAEVSKAKNKRRAAQSLAAIEKWHKAASELALKHSNKLALSL